MFSYQKLLEKVFQEFVFWYVKNLTTLDNIISIFLNLLRLLIKQAQYYQS